MMRRLSLLVAACVAFAVPAFADDIKIGDLVVQHAWSRATPAGAKTGAAYLTIENTGDTADQLIAITSTVAAMTEVHQMSMENDVMKMGAAGIIDIPAHGSVELKPHGLHVMMMGLKQRFNAGDTFTVTLEFAKAGKVDVPVTVGKVDDMGMDH